MCGQNGFRVESPKYLPKSRRRPHTACQVGLRVSEKYSSEFFSFEVFFSFLFFSATFYYVYGWIWQKEMGNKTRTNQPLSLHSSR